MSNSFCKRSLQFRYSMVQGGTLSHDGVMGMRWGYRHFQPYSQGYQAQEKGVFLGQLASKIGGKIKQKFDAWNKIDTSKQMAEIARLQKEAESNYHRASVYGHKNDVAEARFNADRLFGPEGSSESSRRIMSTLTDIVGTYKARAHKASLDAGKIYETARLDTKTKRIKAKIDKILAIGSTNVSDIPSLIKQSKAYKNMSRSEYERIEGRSKGDVAGMLSALAGLTKNQEAMQTSTIVKWIKSSQRFSKDDPRNLAIDQAIKQRQEQGYKSDRDGLMKLVSLLYTSTGNEANYGVSAEQLIPKSQRLWE